MHVHSTRLMPHNEHMQMWSIKLKVLPDGSIAVDDVTGDVPAGEVEVRGCDDGNRAVLEVKQRDPHGRYVTSAHHRRDRAEEALHAAEDLAGTVTEAGGEAVVGVTVAGEVNVP